MTLGGRTWKGIDQGTKKIQKSFLPKKGQICISDCSELSSNQIQTTAASSTDSFGQFSVQLPAMQSRGNLVFGSTQCSPMGSVIPVKTVSDWIDSSLNLQQFSSSKGANSVGHPSKFPDGKLSDFKGALQRPNLTSSVSRPPTDFLPCLNCLGTGHSATLCSQQIHCKKCYNYGHNARWCLTSSSPWVFWRRKGLIWMQSKIKETDLSFDRDMLVSPALVWNSTDSLTSASRKPQYPPSYIQYNLLRLSYNP
jgi:hypothetical protein